MASIDDVLPLKPVHYLLLLCLAEHDLHGYALKKEVARRTDGRVRPGAGSLYRSLRQLADLELIEPTEGPIDPVLDDERRGYYRITAHGRAAAAAETDRLAALVASARSAGIGA